MMIGKYCENACLDGMQDLFESRNNKGKFMFWTIVMVTMVMASAWFTYRTIVGYLDTSTVTSVSTIRSPIMEMPEVLICYNGGLNVLAMKEGNLSENLIRLFHWQFYKPQFKQIPVDDSDLNSARDELNDYIETTNLSVIDIVERFSYGCNDMVAQFVRPSSNLKNCESTEIVANTKGNCYAFTNNGNQTYPSLNGGIIVQLKYPENSFYETFQNEPREFDLGNDFSFTLERNLGGEQSFRWITIAPNTRTEVTLWTKLYKRLSKKVPCENNPSMYSSNTCFTKCYIDVYLRVCNCMENTGWIKFFGQNVSACNPFDQQCSLNETHINECLQCQSNCKPLCSEWIFETSISSTSNPSQALVKIAYNTMQHILVEEVDAFTLDMAIANVGGQSGLWLGCSIITIIQAIYYATISCFKYFCQK